MPSQWNFAQSIKDIHITDLPKHFIQFSHNISPVRNKAPKYTLKKRDFINKIFLATENTGVITSKSSPYKAKTKFFFKKIEIKKRR